MLVLSNRKRPLLVPIQSSPLEPARTDCMREAGLRLSICNAPVSPFCSVLRVVSVRHQRPWFGRSPMPSRPAIGGKGVSDWEWTSPCWYRKTSEVDETHTLPSSAEAIAVATAEPGRGSIEKWSPLSLLMRLPVRISNVPSSATAREEIPAAGSPSLVE